MAGDVLCRRVPQPLLSGYASLHHLSGKRKWSGRRKSTLDLINPIQLAPPVGDFILSANGNFLAEHATHPNTTSSPGKLSDSRHGPRRGKPLLAATFRTPFHDP